MPGRYCEKEQVLTLKLLDYFQLEKNAGGTLFLLMQSAVYENTIKNDFFGICIPMAYYFCMLPDILDNQSRTNKIVYKIYTGVIYTLAFFCHFSQIIKLYQLFIDENFIFDEVVRNYIITSLHFVALLKCRFLRGKVSGKIFKKAIQYENIIYASKNPDVIGLYNETVHSIRHTTCLYFAGIILVVCFYIAAPAFRDPYTITKMNATIEIKQVPMSSWTPFDENQYWPAFVWTSAAGAYLTIFFVTTDLTCFSFIMFGVCQIKILKHFIENFGRYSEDAQERLKCDKAECYRVLQKKYIRMHQEIVRYVSELNLTLKNIMFLDFLPSSIQLAGIMFQMMTNMSVIQCILLGQFICTLIARIYIYCYSSHELAIQSKSIATAWYETNWVEMPKDVQKNIVVCIRRSQIPLRITIGDFEDISMSTFLMILKGTYSYMMLLTTV